MPVNEQVVLLAHFVSQADCSEGKPLTQRQEVMHQCSDGLHVVDVSRLIAHGRTLTTPITLPPSESNGDLVYFTKMFLLPSW